MLLYDTTARRKTMSFLKEEDGEMGVAPLTDTNILCVFLGTILIKLYLCLDSKKVESN